jgi:2-oxoglutarate dehydrogenase E1 component
VSNAKAEKTGQAAVTEGPADFNAPHAEAVHGQRAKMIESGEGIDWAMAEALAFGSLVEEGTKMRLSGQDVERGTFSQRHAVLSTRKPRKRYIPLANARSGPGATSSDQLDAVGRGGARLRVWLFAGRAECLTLWEAQFGDFANGAQVVFDQFLSSGERKWLRMSGLVCLLPHGYEGQGPEHSSARLERFLQMCAEDNMQVANCTTPANYFHILRRQMQRTSASR